MQRPLLLLVALALLAPPIVMGAGSSYRASGVLGTSAVVAGEYQDHRFAARAGDFMDASVTWDPSQGSIVLYIQRVGGTSCERADVECHQRSGGLAGRCGERRAGGGTFLDAEQSATLVADEDATYAVTLVGGVIPQRLFYQVTLQLNGAAPPSVRADAVKQGAGTDGGLACALT